MEQIFGYIERITYQNPENGYSVIQVQEPKKATLTTVVGPMPSIQPGETVRFFGEWKRHATHGLQFEVTNYEVETPSDVEGIKKYLGSGLIKGIGPTFAARIVKRFGAETLTVIEESPKRLLEVSGLGVKRLDLIQTCWEEQKAIRSVMLFLQQYGVSPSFAQKIFKAYGNASVEKVKENPFHLARDIFGIGFKTADTLAEKMGIDRDDPLRIDAGIEHVLSELSNEGHVCYPVEEFLHISQEILGVALDPVDKRLDFLEFEQRIKLQEMPFEGKMARFIWIVSLYAAELGIAFECKRLFEAPCTLRAINTAKATEWAQEQLKISLAEKQADAVKSSLTEKLHIITGGPGTGKSTITNAILIIAEKLTSRILLAAPTGRAAKRMSEITGKTAKTIHSLLEFDFRQRGFKRNRKNPLECDLIIVDEASMIDTPLMNSLLKAIPSHARVIFVGDIHQLPSVGPGNVLKDLIASKLIPVTILSEIFRQAAGSRIITNAHRINQGIFPDITNYSQSDFYFLEVQENEKVLQTIVSLVSHRLPKKFGMDPFEEIQVLAPMKRGGIGTENLNHVLQETLNGKEGGLVRGGMKFLVGDKVMQIRNNYDKEVYNGDVGRIKEINFEEQELTVWMDERVISYDFTELDELVLAYAVSVHKYQGSECPCIVMPIHTSHYKLLHRNLLYTGVTRGKKLVVLVGMKKALAIAVNHDDVKRRYSGLKQALLKAFTQKAAYCL